MKINSKVTDGVVVLKLSGHMSLEDITLIDEQVKEYRKRGHMKFAFNMIDVLNLSSTGISRLLVIHRELESKGGRLVLAEPAAVVDYVLDLAQMKEAFHVYEHEAEALKSFQR